MHLHASIALCDVCNVNVPAPGRKRGARCGFGGGVQVTQYFPPGERGAAFKWKDYSPQVFQRLREIFGIDNKARRAHKC